MSYQSACLQYFYRFISNDLNVFSFIPLSKVIWDAMADFLALPKGACTELVTSTFDIPQETTWTWDALDPMEVNDLELEPETCNLILNLLQFWTVDMVTCHDLIIGLLWVDVMLSCHDMLLFMG